MFLIFLLDFAFPLLIRSDKYLLHSATMNMLGGVRGPILLTTSKDLQLSFQPGVFFGKNAIGRCLQNTRPGKYTHTLTLTHTHTYD